MCDLENHMVLDGPDAPWNSKDASCDDCHSTKRSLNEVNADGEDLELCTPCVEARRRRGEIVKDYDETSDL